MTIDGTTLVLIMMAVMFGLGWILGDTFRGD